MSQIQELISSFDKKDINQFKSLLQNISFDINSPIPGHPQQYSLLHHIIVDYAQTKNTEFIRVLLDHGVKVDISAKDHHTPLTLAYESGHHDVVELLLKCVNIPLINQLPSLHCAKLTRNALDTVYPLELCIKTDIKLENFQLLINEYEQFIKNNSEQFIFFAVKNAQLQSCEPRTISEEQLLLTQLLNYSRLEGVFHMVPQQLHLTGQAANNNDQIVPNNNQTLLPASKNIIPIRRNYPEIGFRLQIYTYNDHFYLHLSRIYGEDQGGILFRRITSIFRKHFEPNYKLSPIYTPFRTDSSQTSQTSTSSNTLGMCDFRTAQEFLSGRPRNTTPIVEAQPDLLSQITPQYGYSLQNFKRTPSRYINIVMNTLTQQESNIIHQYEISQGLGSGESSSTSESSNIDTVQSQHMVDEYGAILLPAASPDDILKQERIQKEEEMKRVLRSVFQVSSGHSYGKTVSQYLKFIADDISSTSPLFTKSKLNTSNNGLDKGEFDSVQDFSNFLGQMTRESTNIPLNSTLEAFEGLTVNISPDDFNLKTQSNIPTELPQKPTTPGSTQNRSYDDHYFARWFQFQTAQKINTIQGEFSREFPQTIVLDESSKKIVHSISNHISLDNYGHVHILLPITYPTPKSSSEEDSEEDNNTDSDSGSDSDSDGDNSSNNDCEIRSKLLQFNPNQNTYLYHLLTHFSSPQVKIDLLTIITCLLHNNQLFRQEQHNIYEDLLRYQREVKDDPSCKAMHHKFNAMIDFYIARLNQSLKADLQFLKTFLDCFITQDWQLPSQTSPQTPPTNISEYQHGKISNAIQDIKNFFLVLQKEDNED
jgi:hypothetical protein